MLLFWAVAGVLTAAAAGLILSRAAHAARAGADDPSQAIYRRQIAELDELADRGLLGEAERRSAHAEAARRLLAAADAPAQSWSADTGARRAVLLAVILVPALALGLYLKLGAPGLPDQPFAPRLAAWRKSDLGALSAPEIAAVLRQETKKRPNEAEGFRLLGLAESASQNPVAAVQALKRAAALSPTRVDIWQMLGEAEVVAAAGKVDADAQAAFRRVLQLSPGEPGARFYLAQARADAGDKAGATSELKALLAEMPAGDERRPVVERAIATVEGRPALAQNPQQMAMIRGMVEGLAARLKSNPDDAEGWVRLVRAYAVLGETKSRDEAYAAARARYAKAPQILDKLDEAARAEAMQ
jgi:cytochrome c-type biogenesis protein CcmH